MGKPEEPQRTPQAHMWEGIDQRWHSFVYVGRKADGSADRRHREADTEEQLIPKVLELEALVAANNVPKPGRSKTFEAWLTYWVATIAPLRVRHTTLRGHGSTIRNYLIPRLGQWRLSELSKRHFVQLYLDLQTEGNLSPSSIHGIHRTASAALNEAIEQEEPGITANVARSARKSLPDLESDSVVPLDTKEISRVTTTVAERRNHVRWWIAFLGARQGEVLGLKWTDVDWETGLISIRRQLQRQIYAHGCPKPKACATSHCISEDGCDQSCRGRRWEHGCQDARECADRHCRRPVYPSDENRGNTRRPCNPDCTGHDRGCPQRVRSKCKVLVHNTACPTDCTSHARHCPARIGGLILAESKPKPTLQESKPRGGRRGSKSKRDLRPKSAAGMRRLPLPAVVRDELRIHQARQEMERIEAGSMWHDLGLIFATRFGAPIDPARDWEAWGEILDEARVDYIELHGARHSAATFLGSLGVDPVIAMAMLGWASPEMAKRYQHVSNEDLVAAGDRLGDAAFGKSATERATGT